MARRLLATLLLTLAAPVFAHAAQALLAWEYQRTFIPPVVGFLATAIDEGGTSQQFQVALSLPGACDATAGATEDTFCTIIACPTPGRVVLYWVQAVTPTEQSAPSAPMTCWFPPGELACRCHAAEEASHDRLPPVPVAPPPLPQKTAEGLNLQPIGPLPPMPTLPPIPTSGHA